MKRTIMMVVIFMFIFVAKARAERKITDEAWSNLRDIHAWHLQNVDKTAWDPQTAHTDAFLENTIKPYFLSVVDENARLRREQDKTEDKIATFSVLAYVAMGVAILLMVAFAFVCFKYKKLIKVKGKGDEGSIISGSGSLVCPRCGTRF